MRSQLCKMQEDWIEEECHRVEAQLALKEARKEIQHLQEVVESVKSNLSDREPDPHHHKPYSGMQGVRSEGRSRSCGCSPAGTLRRGATFMRRSSEALERSFNAPEPSGAAHPSGQTHLLLEAALLSEQLPPRDPHLRGAPAMQHPSTYERLCCGGAVLPVSHSCQSLSSSCRCTRPAYLPHHHLFLHLPQEEPPVTPESAAPTTHTNPIPVPAAEKKPEVRSQGCSPTMTWLCEDISAGELSIISFEKTTTPPEPQTAPASVPPLCPPEQLCRPDPPPFDQPEVANVPTQAQTCQPRPTRPLPVRQEATAVTMDEDMEETDGTNEGGPSPERRHWSSYFLVDLLALAIPVVPTMAWLCRGAPQEVVPVYHIGSMLRGCCAIALHSLRRQGAGRRPTSPSGTAADTGHVDSALNPCR